MGWSCTSAAGDTEDRISMACRKLSGSSNRFRSGDTWFFYEVDRIEHEDGRITGEVNRCTTGDRCIQHSRFIITSDGRVLGGHKWMRDAAKP